MVKNKYIIYFLLIVVLGLGAYIYFNAQSSNDDIVDQLQQQLNQKDSVIQYYQRENVVLSNRIEVFKTRDSTLNEMQARYDEQIANIHKYYDRKIAAMDSNISIDRLEQFFEERYDSIR